MALTFVYDIQTASSVAALITQVNAILATDTGWQTIGFATAIDPITPTYAQTMLQIIQ